MSLAELKEAVEHVTSGNAKLGEVIYGDDGLDMALDIDTVIGIVRDLAAKEPRDPGHANKGAQCTLCGASISFDEWEAWHEKHGWGFAEHGPEPEFAIAHKAECPYRRAVEAARV